MHPGKVRNDGQKLSYQLETHIELKCQKQLLETALALRKTLETWLAADMDPREQCLDTIACQRYQMRAKPSAADAMSQAKSTNLHQIHEVDELFDRWGMKISESGMMIGEFDSMAVLEKISFKKII